MARKRGVYAIIHTATGRAYVGCSGDIDARWLWHQQHLAAGRHHSRQLQRAWTAHGSAAFTFAVLEDVAPGVALRPREEWWMRAYAARLLNAMPENRHGAESRAAMSKSQTEAWQLRYAEGRERATPEARAEIARGTRRWASQLRVRAQKSLAARKTNAAANFRTPEALAKNAEALRGVPKSAAHRAAMKLAHSSGACRCHPRKAPPPENPT